MSYRTFFFHWRDGIVFGLHYLKKIYESMFFSLFFSKNGKAGQRETKHFMIRYGFRT